MMAHEQWHKDQQILDDMNARFERRNAERLEAEREARLNDLFKRNRMMR